MTVTKNLDGTYTLTPSASEQVVLSRLEVASGPTALAFPVEQWIASQRDYFTGMDARNLYVQYLTLSPAVQQTVLTQLASGVATAPQGV